MMILNKSAVCGKLGLTMLVLVLFVGCNENVITNKSPMTNVVAKNHKFTIILPEDHRDGVTWQLKDDYDHSVIQRLNEVWHGNEKGIYFNLKAKETGKTMLNLVKRKYTDTVDTKHFIIIVGSE
jgi:hypothetical protein